MTGEQLAAFLEQRGARLAEYELWRLALDEEGGRVHALRDHARAASASVGAAG